MNTLSILVRVYIWVLCFINWRLLERSWAIGLSIVLWIVKLLCSCLCLFDVIIDVMNKKRVKRLSHWKVKMEFISSKALFDSQFL